jgi:hypothetical protein
MGGGPAPLNPMDTAPTPTPLPGPAPKAVRPVGSRKGLVIAVMVVAIVVIALLVYLVVTAK